MQRKRASSDKAILLFAALLEGVAGWQHGYALSKSTGLKSGTLYPLLMRLKERGFLESTWENSTFPGRPARQVYRLTDEGRSFALAEMSARRAKDMRAGLAAI